MIMMMVRKAWEIVPSGAMLLFGGWWKLLLDSDGYEFLHYEI